MKKKILAITESCTACMACFNICPIDAISMQEDIEGFFYPIIDEEKCTNCLLCDRVCPIIKKNNKVKTNLIKKAYYGWHNNDDIRKKSSSGGIFSAIAELIMDKDGIVFGASYDNSKNMVMHKSTGETSINSLRKSKYVQSYIGNSFRKVKELLDDDRYVFYIGTPCQIDGLQNFLGKKNSKLITCDFICHGVPPMKLLNDDLHLFERKNKSKVIGFDFRPKIKRWSFDYFSIFFDLKKKNRINIPWNYDRYFKGFISNLILRTSCYSCIYSATQHTSDLTIADYWGYKYYDESIFDNRGLSLILVNTKKGKELFETLNSDDVTLKPIDWEYAEYVFHERNNNNYNREKRDIFFKDYIEFGYRYATKKHDLKTKVSTKIVNNVVILKKKVRIFFNG